MLYTIARPRQRLIKNLESEQLNVYDDFNTKIRRETGSGCKKLTD